MDALIDGVVWVFRRARRASPVWLAVAVLAVALLAALALSPGAVSGQVGTPGVRNVGEDGILSGIINIDQEDNDDDRYPAAVYAADQDAYLVVWEEDNLAGTSSIVGRWVSAAGVLLGEKITVAGGTGLQNRHTAAAYSPADQRAVVAYTRGPGVFVRTVRPNGEVSAEYNVWIESGEGASTAYPSVAYNSRENEFLVAWESHRSNGLVEIVARRAKIGYTINTPWVVVASGVGGDLLNRYTPSAAYHPGSGRYLVAYSTRANAATSTINAKLYDAVLNPLSGTPLALSGGPGDQVEPYAAANAYSGAGATEDGFLVAWVNRVPEGSAVLARRVSGAGAALANVLSLTGLMPYHQEFPSAAQVADGRYLISWRGDSAASDSGSALTGDIFARYAMHEQNLVSGDVFAVDVSSASQTDASAACARLACLLVEADNWPGNDYEIRARLLEPYRVMLPWVRR